MGLLELCLLPLLLPQDPATGAAAPKPAPAAAVQAAPAAPDGDDLARLQAAERAGAKADVADLTELCLKAAAPIATRAAWLLGNTKSAQTAACCGEVALGSPHADARLQAMSALFRLGENASLPTGTKGLEDADRRVRTIAAQLLGKLRRPGSTAPLLALLDRSRNKPADGTATDLQAALLALNDLGAADLLLRAATAIGDGKAVGTGEALTFCFQNLSPKLERKQEVTLLVGVLDHREPLLRRYAIGRLAELDDASAAKALEGRLAKESHELRPLVEVALTQLRKDDRPAPSDELERAMANLRSLGARAEGRWNTLSETQRWIAGGVPVAFVLLFWMLGRRRRRSASRASAAAAVAMVAPSDEYLQEMAAEAEALADASEAAIEEDAPAEDATDWVEPHPALANGRPTHGARRR